ncbi:hypothetical protein [Burkholderia sp. PU8-34]
MKFSESIGVRQSETLLFYRVTTALSLSGLHGGVGAKAGIAADAGMAFLLYLTYINHTTVATASGSQICHNVIYFDVWPVIPGAHRVRVPLVAEHALLPPRLTRRRP